MTNAANAAKRIAIAAAFGVVVSGCVTTQEMPLAPNVVRLDTHATGAVFTGQAVPQTMRRAAELTLQNGYAYFRLDQPEMSQGVQYAGSYNTMSGFGFGNSAFVSGNSTPIMARTADVGVTVTMFHPNEPGAKGAFNAAEVLKKYSQ